MASKKCLSLQDFLNAFLWSDNEENDLEINSDNSFNEDCSEKINLLQLIKKFDDEQAVFKDVMFLPSCCRPPQQIV